MRQHEHKRPSTIESEVAAQRADIADTVAEIKERLSPSELLEGFLRDSRTRDVVARIGPAIGRNPLPAVLIGIGVLWLALSSARPERVPLARRPRTGPVSRAAMLVGRETIMAVSRDNLTAWLRDAYAMENQAIEILEKQANRLEHYPELRAKVRSHLDQVAPPSRAGGALPASARDGYVRVEDRPRQDSRHGAATVRPVCQ